MAITRSTSALQIDKADLEAVAAELRKMMDGISEQEKRREIVKPAGDLVQGIAQSISPRSARPHFRYRTAKLTKSLRAPKGMGQKVATYLPGNLANSIIDIADRKKKYRTGRVIIGPYYRSWKTLLKSGVYGKTDKTADGYYAHMVYGSARAFRKNVTGAALQFAKAAVLAIISKGVEKYFDQAGQKNNYWK